MNERKAMIGLALYHSIDLTARAELVDEILAAAKTVTGSSTVGYMSGQLAASDRFSRQQTISTDNLEQLRTDLRGKVFRSVQFDQLPKSQQEVSGGYATLHIELKAAKSPKISSNEVALFPYRLYMLFPRDSLLTGEQLREGLGRFLLALDAPYAFVTVGRDWSDVLMEVVSTPIFPRGRELSNDELRRKARLSRCQTERVRVGAVTCGAYWGNVLGRHMLDRLGGFERVRREAPVALADDLPAGAMYLQLTNDLPDLAAPEYQQGLETLDTYLRPVSVMHGPEQTI